MLLNVDNVSFSYNSLPVLNQFCMSLMTGKSMAIVGESGCGKSTLVQLLLGWLTPMEGQIVFNEQIFSNHPVRSGEIQVILQNIDDSLNPRMSAFELIEEPLLYQKQWSKAKRTEKVNEMAKKVGLLPDALSKYPHAFSGGQKQRIAIARAMILRPKLLVCDEATSSLDATVAKSILQLLKHEISDAGMSLLLITHDIRLATWMCDEICVMNHGQLVERIDSMKLLKQSTHSHTKKLLNACQLKLMIEKSEKEYCK